MGLREVQADVPAREWRSGCSSSRATSFWVIAQLFRGCPLSGLPQHLVFDRGHVSCQAAEGLCHLRALAREAGDHIPEVIDFLAKFLVLGDQPRDYRVELLLLLCGLSKPVKQALRVLEPASEFRGKV